MSATDYIVREGRSSDEGFVASTYVATARMATPRSQLRHMPDGAFTGWHHAHVRALLRRCELRVAASREDDEAIYGYSLLDGNQVHMVYVSKSHWRSGIGRALLKGLTFSEVVFRLWPNTMHGSETAWLWPKVESLTYFPYWMELPNGKPE